MKGRNDRPTSNLVGWLTLGKRIVEGKGEILGHVQVGKAPKGRAQDQIEEMSGKMYHSEGVEGWMTIGASLYLACCWFVCQSQTFPRLVEHGGHDNPG